MSIPSRDSPPVKRTVAAQLLDSHNACQHDRHPSSATSFDSLGSYQFSCVFLSTQSLFPTPLLASSAAAVVHIVAV